MITSKSAKSFRESPPDSLKCAQVAADNDNFKSAYARIVKYMPIAPIGPENESILRALFPKSLGLNKRSDDSDTEMGDPTSTGGDAPQQDGPHQETSRRGMTTRSATLAELTKKRVVIAPGDITQTLGCLKRGRAPGVQADSLDIFIKLQRRRAMENRKKKKRRKNTAVASTLASFFTIIINGDVGPRVEELVRVTYTVALQKDPHDLKKLRPLGIPSAIRRIAASLVLGMYRSRFAKLLLPVNMQSELVVVLI